MIDLLIDRNEKYELTLKWFLNDLRKNIKKTKYKQRKNNCDFIYNDMATFIN